MADQQEMPTQIDIALQRLAETGLTDPQAPVARFSSAF